MAKMKNARPPFISSTPGPHRAAFLLEKRHGAKRAESPDGIGVAEREDLAVLFRGAGKSELDAGVSAVEFFYFGDIADAFRKQLNETGDPGRMVAGRFAFDEFPDQGDDVLLLPAGVAEVRIHRMASMTREAVIVTGASRGIGAAVARMVGANGLPVVVNYVKHKSAAEAVVGEIVSAGGRAVAVQGDVGKEWDILAIVRGGGGGVWSGWESGE